MPLSNCVRFSYALKSGGFRIKSASKSRRSNKIALHSLQSLISTFIKPVVPDFSAVVFDTTTISITTQNPVKITHKALYSTALQPNTPSPDHHIQLARKFYSGVGGTYKRKNLADKMDISKR